MKTIYKPTQAVLIDEDGTEYISYGISIHDNDALTTIYAVDNIFTDASKAASLAKLCTDLELAPEQLDDIIADALAVI